MIAYILCTWAGFSIGFFIGAWWQSTRQLDQEQDDENNHPGNFVG
jgi:hypothetical protein